MPTNTRTLFKALLRECQVDCILDIGSCDGSDSLRLRRIFPAAKIFAFEANPFLYQIMVANVALSENHVQIFPFAMSNVRGTARFHVTDLNYEHDGLKNPGTSSLLVHEDLKLHETVEAQTYRIDDFVLSHCPEARRIGLWIDVEGAEFMVLEGVTAIKDRIVAVHVETARTPMRIGQKVFATLDELMTSSGLAFFGTNMGPTSNWGDVVYVRKELISKLSLRFSVWRLVAKLSYWGERSKILFFLQKHCSPFYRLLMRLYEKLLR